MKTTVIYLSVLMFLLMPNLAGATDEGSFEVKTTSDLYELCTTPPDDPLYGAAINFCHGYLVGAFHYYTVVSAGPKGTKLVCMPDPPPSRNKVISLFIEWMKAHPEYADEVPVETEFRFLMENWSCK